MSLKYERYICDVILNVSVTLPDPGDLSAAKIK